MLATAAAINSSSDLEIIMDTSGNCIAVTVYNYSWNLP
jgi:hypothetical protein